MGSDAMGWIFSLIFTALVFTIPIILIHKSMSGNCKRCNTCFHSKQRFCRLCGTGITRTFEYIDSGAQYD